MAGAAASRGRARVSTLRAPPNAAAPVARRGWTGEPGEAAATGAAGVAGGAGVTAGAGAAGFAAGAGAPEQAASTEKRMRTRARGSPGRRERGRRTGP